MIRLNIDQLLFLGSAGFAVLSLASPFPPLKEIDTPNHSIASLSRSQDKELTLTYPPALIAGVRQDAPVKKELPEPEHPMSTPDVEGPTVVNPQTLLYVRPTLAMPGNIFTYEKNDAEAEDDQLTQNVASSLLVKATQPKNASLDAKAVEEVPVKKIETLPAKEPVIGDAQRIEVQSIGIDIPVRPGTYDTETQSWTVDDSSAFHAETTVPVNDTNGTTLIYGHARWGIFGALPDLRPGAEATVYSADGLRFIYTFESLREVDPSDVSMLTAEGEPRLLLQTCSGLLDQHRTLVTFTLKEVANG